MNIIDIVGIVIVVISGVIAFKKGFVKTFFSFISTFVALILAFTLCNVGVDIIKENTGIDEWLQKTLTTSLESFEENNKNDEVIENVEEANKNAITKTFEDLPQNIKEMVGVEEYKENAKVTIVETSIEVILKILSWVIIYFVVRVALMLICIIFDGIMSIPFLKQINNLAGLAVGIILRFI